MTGKEGRKKRNKRGGKRNTREKGLSGGWGSSVIQLEREVESVRLGLCDRLYMCRVFFFCITISFPYK